MAIVLRESVTAYPQTLEPIVQSVPVLLLNSITQFPKRVLHPVQQGHILIYFPKLANHVNPHALDALITLQNAQVV